MSSGASRWVIVLSAGLSCCALLGLCGAARGDGNAISITQYGITWNFSEAVPVGQFVNGDYYVVGPATITSITPTPIYDPNGIARNGSVLNLTTNRGYTGFDNRLEAGRYSSGFDAHLPIAITPGDALVSSISMSASEFDKYPNMFRPSDTSPDPIKTAAVLTCLASQVPADTFRPSYLDRKQTNLYHASDLQWDLLPNLSLQGVTMRSENFAFTIDSIAAMFQRPWLDTIEFGFAAPMQNMPVYGREVARLAGVGTLLLESNYTQAQKTPLLVNMVQAGIDHWGIVQAGYYGWEAFGGHNSGREWLMIFAGMMLGDANMAQPSKTFPNLKLQEDMQTIYAQGWTGTNVVYAGHYGTDGSGAYGPYEHLWPTQWVSDMNENYRRTSTTVGWIAEALAARLLGAVDVWDHPAFFDYVDRWMAEANDATFRQILLETRGLNYADWAWEGQTWDPFVMDLWNRYRGYIAPLPASNWYGAAGNWSDANNWPAGEPNAGLSACITNGGVVTVFQTGRSCSFLAVGGVPGEAGTVNLSGGSLAVGTQVRIGYSGVVNLQGGALVSSSDANRGVSIVNDGMLHVWNGDYTVGTVVNSDSNVLAGMVIVDSNASLSVVGIRQNAVTVNGMLTIRGGAVPVGGAGGSLFVGSSAGHSGAVSMAGGTLDHDAVYVGYAGGGTFQQTEGTHRVSGSLSIATESGSTGTYSLEGGYLFAGEIVVGGSSAEKGGIGTFDICGGNASVDGELIIWDGSEAHLGDGTLAGSDANHPCVDVENSGTLYIEDGVYCLGRLTGIGDTWTGTTVVRSGATLWVESMEQDSLVIEAGGEVHFAGENYELFMSLARENQRLVPEPATLVLLCLGAAALIRRGKR